MKVWVTRDEAPAGPLGEALRGEGLEPVLEPVVQRRVLTDAADELSRLGPDDWLVLTSVFAIENVSPAHARIPQVAVVGEPSRLAAESRGFRVKLVSSREDGSSLWEELRAIVKRGKICYPRSSLARPPAAWDAMELICPVLYETVPREFDRLVFKRVEMIAFASPSAVEALCAGGVELRSRPCASIGPTTSEALRRLGVEPAVEAPQRSFVSLARAIAEYARQAATKSQSTPDANR